MSGPALVRSPAGNNLRQIGPEDVVDTEPLQYGCEARRITHRSAEIPGAIVHCCHLGMALAFVDISSEPRAVGGANLCVQEGSADSRAVAKLLTSQMRVSGQLLNPPKSRMPRVRQLAGD